MSIDNIIEASADSPLAEADPSSIDELMRRAEVVFNMKPLNYTDPDVDTATRYYQAKRAYFAQLAREKENAEPKQKRTKATSVAQALELAISKIEI